MPHPPLHISMNQKTATALDKLQSITGLSRTAAVRFAVISMAEAMKTARAVTEESGTKGSQSPNQPEND